MVTTILQTIFSAFLLTVFVLCTAVHIDSKEGRLNYIYATIYCLVMMLLVRRI